MLILYASPFLVISIAKFKDGGRQKLCNCASKETPFFPFFSSFLRYSVISNEIGIRHVGGFFYKI